MIIILECPPRPSTSHKQDIRKSAKTTQDGPEQGPRREPRPALQPHSCASTEAAVALHSHLQGLGGTTSQQNNHLKDYTQTHTGQREALAPEDAECALPPHLDPARRRAEAAQRTPGPRRRAARFSSCWREEARLQQLPQLGGARSHLTTEAEARPRRGRAPERPEHLKSHRPDQSSPSESERETLTHGHRGHHLGGHLPTEPSQHKTGGLCVSPTAAVTNGRRWSGLQQHTLTFFLSRGEDQPHWAKVGYAGVGRAGLFWGPSGRIHLYALFSAARGLAVCTPWLVAPSSRTSLQPLLLPHLYELRPLT